MFYDTELNNQVQLIKCNGLNMCQLNCGVTIIDLSKTNISNMLHLHLNNTYATKYHSSTLNTNTLAKYKKNNYMGYSTFTKLYESCVCPIVDYSSGVWGFEDFQTTTQLQNKAQRIFLGVHKFAPILGLEGDMGWLEPKYRPW